MDSTQTDLKHKHIKDESLLAVLVFIKHFAELSHRCSLSLNLMSPLKQNTQHKPKYILYAGILKGTPYVSLDFIIWILVISM